MSILQLPNEVMSDANVRSIPALIKYRLPSCHGSWSSTKLILEQRKDFDTTKTYHSITIKPLSMSKTYYRSDIDQFIEKHLKAFDIIYITYEQDSKHILHAHILASTNTSEFTKIKPVRYWHIYNEATENKERYIGYIQKHAKNQYQQMEELLNHFSFHNNLFTLLEKE